MRSSGVILCLASAAAFGTMGIFGKLSYEVALRELRPGEVLERGDYRLEAFAVAHGVSAIGYALVEEKRGPRAPHPNRVSPEIEAHILDYALTKPEVRFVTFRHFESASLSMAILKALRTRTSFIGALVVLMS